MNSGDVEVVEYRPEWHDHFLLLQEKIAVPLGDVAIAIEHVGSTAVAGLAGKPIIDMDVVVSSRSDVPIAIARLARIGYEHCGNLGIEDRDAFRYLADGPAHNLYVCPLASLALRNHVAVRDHLRTHPSDVLAYANLKQQLAQQFTHDRDKYSSGKTAFILSILAQANFDAGSLDAIRRANRRASG